MLMCHVLMSCGRVVQGSTGMVCYWYGMLLVWYATGMVCYWYGVGWYYTSWYHMYQVGTR